MWIIGAPVQGKRTARGPGDRSAKTRKIRVDQPAAGTGGRLGGGTGGVSGVFIQGNDQKKSGAATTNSN